LSEDWINCEQDELKSIVKQDRFKLTLVITDDMAVYKYTEENKEGLLYLGSFGFSFDPEKDTVLYWIKDVSGSYYYREVVDSELFNYYPHHELVGRKVDKSFREVIKKCQ
jgi:hypothetical protein